MVSHPDACVCVFVQLCPAVRISAKQSKGLWSVAGIWCFWLVLQWLICTKKTNQGRSLSFIANALPVEKSNCGKDHTTRYLCFYLPDNFGALKSAFVIYIKFVDPRILRLNIYEWVRRVLHAYCQDELLESKSKGFLLEHGHSVGVSLRRFYPISLGELIDTIFSRLNMVKNII